MLDHADLTFNPRTICKFDSSYFIDFASFKEFIFYLNQYNFGCVLPNLIND